MTLLELTYKVEEELAMKYFGVPYEELDEDDRADITCEMYDILKLESN